MITQQPFKLGNMTKEYYWSFRHSSNDKFDVLIHCVLDTGLSILAWIDYKNRLAWIPNPSTLNMAAYVKLPMNEILHSYYSVPENVIYEIKTRLESSDIGRCLADLAGKK